MELKVIENALDFITRGANDFWDERLSEEQQAKYSTIHLYEGIELLLKARLIREHWSLIINDPDKYKRDSFERGDFVSVAYDAARGRLNSICKVTLDEQANQAFNQLRQYRNRYVHFMCDEPRASIIGVQLQAWHHTLRLLESGFLGELDGRQLAGIENVKNAMMRSEDFLSTRFQLALEAIQDAREDGWLVAECPTCGKNSLLVGGGDASCPVCGKSEISSTEAAESYVSEKVPWWEIKDGADPLPVGWCEDCGEESVVLASKELVKQVADKLPETPQKGEKVYVCFACGKPTLERWVEHCGSCAALFFRSDNDPSAVSCPGCGRWT